MMRDKAKWIATNSLLLVASLGNAGLSSGDAAKAAAVSRSNSELAVQVEQAASVRAVKRLQRSYAQYAQFGLWSQMASLFAKNGEAVFDRETLQGPAEILAYLRTTYGAGDEGLPPGGVHTLMQIAPVVTVSPDGRHAKGRWHELAMLGRYGDQARWAGGILENDYVKKDGVWKISRLHYYPMLAGPYETGWRNVEADLKAIPYHYTPTQAGAPAPVNASNATADAAPPLATLRARIAAMNDSDAVRNLQNAYGYYVDRKMWDDVTDLFAADGSLEIAGQGFYRGKAGIRRDLERRGPAGLRRGELNDHILFDMTVRVRGDAARARGLELGMLGDVGKGTASWSVAVFENSYVKRNGIWRIQTMHRFPLWAADYYKGWGRSRLPSAPPDAEHAPDGPAGDAMKAGAIPAFFANPVTGEPVAAPAGHHLVGVDDLIARPAAPSPRAPAPMARLNRASRVAKARLGLRCAVAYDAVENISSAFGNYIDDFAWDKSSALFARDGARAKFLAGFYIGPDRIYEAEVTELGLPRRGQASGQIHMRIQPVINMSADCTSAKLRTRLFHPYTSAQSAGSFSSGMYPNDVAIREDGVWKFENVAIDEPYFNSASYKSGWARLEPGPGPHGHHIPMRLVYKLTTRLPPDVPLEAMGAREHGFRAGDRITWPAIAPMWFSYKNPVSGRVPPHYCPDEGTCYRNVSAPSRSAAP